MRIRIRNTVIKFLVLPETGVYCTEKSNTKPVQRFVHQETLPRLVVVAILLAKAYTMLQDKLP